MTIAVIDEREISITPVFKYQEVENVPKSEAAGHAVFEVRELVEVRFAGNKHYSPVFGAHDFWKRDGNRTITYAERWADQYRTFKEGGPQEANGTPLEMLRGQGVTPELISLCRALKIYSIEALYHLEGPAVKSLGMNANRLKDAARAFMADRMGKGAALDEVEALRARIAELEARSTVPPEQEAAPEEIEALVDEVDAEFAALSDDQIKEAIAALAGSKPRGNPSRQTLETSLRELRAAA